MSTPKTENRRGLIPAPPAGARPPRGWPVVATGSGGRTPAEERARFARRRALGLPEESESFSDRDALDVAALLLRRQGADDLPPLVRLALEKGPARVAPGAVGPFLRDHRGTESPRAPRFDPCHGKDCA
jgi:hypothetical protein